MRLQIKIPSTTCFIILLNITVKGHEWPKLDTFSLFGEESGNITIVVYAPLIFSIMRLLLCLRDALHTSASPPFL
jgi:hypothetical protein